MSSTTFQPGDCLTMSEVSAHLRISRVKARKLVAEHGLPLIENPLDRRQKLIPAVYVYRLGHKARPPVSTRPARERQKQAAALAS